MIMMIVFTIYQFSTKVVKVVMTIHILFFNFVKDTLIDDHVTLESENTTSIFPLNHPGNCSVTFQ